jgi:hypothetical protein
MFFREIDVYSLIFAVFYDHDLFPPAICVALDFVCPPITPIMIPPAKG